MRGEVSPYPSLGVDGDAVVSSSSGQPSPAAVPPDSATMPTPTFEEREKSFYDSATLPTTKFDECEKICFEENHEFHT